jgi:hypothetical protein
MWRMTTNEEAVVEQDGEEPEPLGRNIGHDGFWPSSCLSTVLVLRNRERKVSTSRACGQTSAGRWRGCLHLFCLIQSSDCCCRLWWDAEGHRASGPGDDLAPRTRPGK